MRMPILLVGLDFKEKKVKILGKFKEFGTEELDIRSIKEKFIGVNAKYPKLFELGDRVQEPEEPYLYRYFRSSQPIW